jgi:hypothetical protein
LLWRLLLLEFHFTGGALGVKEITGVEETMGVGGSFGRGGGEVECVVVDDESFRISSVF